MKIKSRRNFIAGIICALLAIVALVFYIFAKENRLIISFVLLVAMSIFNFEISFSKKGYFEKIRELNDERDQYLTMKTSHILLCVMNYALAGFIFIFAISYGIWKISNLLVIMYTLGGVLVFMFITYLIINFHINK